MEYSAKEFVLVGGMMTGAIMLANKKFRQLFRDEAEVKQPLRPVGAPALPFDDDHGPVAGATQDRHSVSDPPLPPLRRQK